MKKEIKRLYKSETDVLIWGILGGIGEYFDLDPTVLRLGYVVLVLITGVFPGLIAYIIAYFIIPERPAHGHTMGDETAPKKPETPTTPVMSEIIPEKEEVVEDVGELKKPNWPPLESLVSPEKPESDGLGNTLNLDELDYPEIESENLTLDELMESQGDELELNDIVDE
jgi:phage shock protein C